MNKLGKKKKQFGSRKLEIYVWGLSVYFEPIQKLLAIENKNGP